MTASRVLWQQILARWREFRREPSAFFFVMAMPVMWLLILGYGLDGEDRTRTQIGWLTGGSYINAPANLFEDKRIRLRTGSEQELDRLLQRGRIDLVVAARDNAVELRADPKHPNAGMAKMIVGDALQRAAGRQDVISITTRDVATIGQRYVDFLIPGLLALSIMTSSLFGTGMTIVANRREGLLRRYRVTPMPGWTYIASHAVGRLIILIFETLPVLIIGWLLFDFQVRGPWWQFAGVIAIGTFAFTSLAMLLAARTTNTAAVMAVTNLVALPLMLVSGIWFSREYFPDWIATGIGWLPLAPLVDALRESAVTAAPQASVMWSSAAILAAYGVVASVIALLVFRWQE